MIIVAAYHGLGGAGGALAAFQLVQLWLLSVVSGREAAERAGQGRQASVRTPRGEAYSWSQPPLRQPARQHLAQCRHAALGSRPRG